MRALGSEFIVAHVQHDVLDAAVVEVRLRDNEGSFVVGIPGQLLYLHH